MHVRNAARRSSICWACRAASEPISAMTDSLSVDDAVRFTRLKYASV